MSAVPKEVFKETSGSLKQNRLLVISHVKEVRNANGGTVFTNGLIELLKREFADVHVEYVYQSTPRWRRARIAMAFLRSGLSGVAAKIEYFRVNDARERIGKSVKRLLPDMVIFDHLETVLYAPLLDARVKKLLIQHNDEAALYAQRVSRIGSPLLRAVLETELKRLGRFQDKAYALCGNAIFLSADEASKASKGSTLRSCTLMPSFDYPPIPVVKRAATELHLLFVGTMDWWPNTDALNWFVEEILDKLPGNVVLHVVGRGSERWSGRHPKIVAHGFVADRADVWNLAPIFIAPLRLGAGVNIKVAEAIHNGRALVATPQALRGLSLEADDAIVSLESADDWIALLSDSARVAALSSAAPSLANRDSFGRERAQGRLVEYLETL
jgi:polysaccharide biosynthesis protein PslH